MRVQLKQRPSNPSGFEVMVLVYSTGDFLVNTELKFSLRSLRLNSSGDVRLNKKAVRD